MKVNYVNILLYLLQRKKSHEAVVETREVADAVGLSIYQARQHLEFLASKGLIQKINSGRGRPNTWKVI